MVSILFMVVSVGAVINNLTNSGVIAPAQTQSDCTALGATFSGGTCFKCDNALDTCTIATLVGCQAQPPAGGNPLGNCALQGSALSVLNPCSTFTAMLTLNPVAFVDSFFNSCGTPKTVYANNNVTLPTSGTVTLSVCKHTGFKDPSLGWMEAFCYSMSPTMAGFVMPAKANWAISYWDGVIGNASEGSVPLLVPTEINDNSSSTNFITAQCATYGDYTGHPGQVGDYVKYLVCQGSTFQTSSITPSVASSGLNVSGILAFALSLIGGLLVVFIALGIGISGSIEGLTFGTSGSFWSNPQGTRLAQTFGIATLIWFPLYSEFSPWFTSGYLPFGLDGQLFAAPPGIIAFVLTFFFFVGVYFLNLGGGGGGAAASSTQTTSQAKT